MKKPYPLDCETVEIDGKRVRMFPIGKQEIWLVGMVTGKRDCRRVLKRCNIFIMLKDRLRASIESTASSKEELAGDSKMAAMRFDDDEEESPMKKNRKRGLETDEDQPGRRARNATATPPIQVRVPEEASSKEERDVWLMARRNRLWIDEDNLAWIAPWVKAELKSGGIAPIEEETAERQDVWWDFHDDCWVAQRTHECGADGQHVQRRGYVMRRLGVRGDPCFGLSKDAAKKIVFDELSEWVRLAK